MRAFAALAVLLLAAPLGLGASQDDAGRGTDAPGDGQAPWTLAEGTYLGTLDVPAGDRQDWYAVPLGSAFAAHVAIASDHVCCRYAAALVLNGNAMPQGLDNGAASWDVQIHAGDTMQVVILNDRSTISPALAYTLTITLDTLPRLAVRNLTVATRDTTLAGAAPALATLQRDVAFDVVNDGALLSQASIRVNVSTTTASHIVKIFALDVPARGRVHVVVPWDAIGFLGDVRVTATAFDDWDTNHADDAQTVLTYVLVPGDGVGIGLP